MSLLGVNWGNFYDAARTKVPHDVKFKVLDPNDPPNFKVFSAHKLLLAAVSSAFEVQFFGDHFDATDDILVEDSQPEAFEKFLQFIYFGKKAEIAPSVKFCDMKTIQLVYDVMVLADKYFVDELKEVCEWLLINSTTVTEDNIFDLVRLAEDNLHFATTRKEIKRKSAEFLKENIGNYGFVFIKKLNNQPSFNQDIFSDLCAAGDGSQDEEKDGSNHSYILDRTDIKKHCTIS
eukprot:GFUD01009498.1.p1 GENE.GFUD01009498.1~~GFUD01009498.1.p1  ORF type:complete len:233 (+),score=48.71 GFUD01009498.1:46-744(+)